MEQCFSVASLGRTDPHLATYRLRFYTFAVRQVNRTVLNGHHEIEVTGVYKDITGGCSGTLR